MRHTDAAGSTTHRALLIPELLDTIFNFLDRDANVTNACVCKRWSDIALDVVWKQVDDLIYLFGLLKPILREEDTLENVSRYVFETLPEASDWSRFEKYASRVRSFKPRLSAYELDICTLLDDVARTRTSLEILPNMHTLEWIYISPAHMERCKLFLHRRLRHLSVTAPSQTHPRPDFYTDLCARAPNLHSLALFVNFPGKPIDADLRILLQSLPELKTIVLPEFHYTSAVIEELSRAKHIRVIDFNQDLELGYGNPANVASFAPLLEQGAFPSLQTLNLSARVDDIDRFFRSTFAPVHIKLLYLNSYTDHTPAEVHAFFTTLAQRCPDLTQLNLQLYHKVLASHLPTDRQLSYDTIKPLLTLPALTSFELVHKYPLNMSLDDIDDLARRWPHAESLMLNAEPLFLAEDAAALDLRALLPFAQHCPRLHHLGLYVLASPASIPPWHVPLEPFSALRTLSVGTSSVQNASAVAMFLSRILGPSCVIEMGISWTEFGCEDDRFLPTELKRPLQLRCMEWQAVERLLPALIRLRRVEEAQSRSLRQEVEDLRIQNRLLMDKGGAQTKDTCLLA